MKLLHTIIVGSLVVIVALVGYFVVKAREHDYALGVRSPGAEGPQKSDLRADRFERPQRQRTWADLYAACEAMDSALGADLDGNPVCYPLGKKAGAP